MLSRLRLYYAEQYTARIIHNSSFKQGLGLLTDAEAGFFIKLDQYFLLPVIDIKPDTYVDTSELILSNQAFGIWQLIYDDEVIAYALQSTLQTKYSGSFVSGFLASKINKKHEVNILLKTSALSVLEYKGAGFMAISNILSEPMSVIMEEQ